MSDPPPVERHAAADRAGKITIRIAHELTAAAAEADGGAEPVVLRRNGPHRSIEGLLALLDEVLDEDGDATIGH